MNLANYVPHGANPSINSDAGDEAAGAGYVKRYVSNRTFYQRILTGGTNVKY